MKRYGFVIIIIILIVFSGCKKNQPVEDLPEDGVVAVDEDPSLEPDTDIEPEDETQVTDDTYGTEDDWVISDDLAIDDDTVVDPDIPAPVLQQMMDRMHYAYYNYLWQTSEAEEAITRENMKAFAVSYIYQYEYNDLYFDATDFVLYIPENLISTITQLYFDTSITNHGMEHELVVYEDAHYLMAAMDDGRVYDPVVVRMKRLSDNTYEAVFKSSDPNVGIHDPRPYYHLVFEQKNGKLIYTQYFVEQVVPGEDTEEAETTEGD